MWKKGEKKKQDRKYILPILHQTKFWLNQKTKTAFSIGFLKAWWGTHSERGPLQSIIVTKCLSLLIENLTHSELAGVPSFLREKTLFSKKQPSLTI